MASYQETRGMAGRNFPPFHDPRIQFNGMPINEDGFIIYGYNTDINRPGVYETTPMQWPVLFDEDGFIEGYDVDIYRRGTSDAIDLPALNQPLLRATPREESLSPQHGHTGHQEAVSTPPLSPDYFPRSPTPASVKSSPIPASILSSPIYPPRLPLSPTSSPRTDSPGSQWSPASAPRLVSPGSPTPNPAPLDPASVRSPAYIPRSPTYVLSPPSLPTRDPTSPIYVPSSLLSPSGGPDSPIYVPSSPSEGPTSPIYVPSSPSAPGHDGPSLPWSLDYSPASPRSPRVLTLDESPRYTPSLTSPR